MKIFDTLGGVVATHAAVGVGAFLVGRGWITLDQAHSLVDEAKNLWISLSLTGAGAAAAIAGKYANRD